MIHSKKKRALILLIFHFCVSTSLVAQIDFKQAYFIDNSGEKIECLIKDVEWKSNPTSFEYKLSDDAKVQIAKIDNVEMFQIGNSGKYLRKTLDVDRWDVFSPVTSQKHPSYKSETLFLKELTNGVAKLYSYTDGSYTAYFFQVDNSEIAQLIRKDYIGEDRDGKEKRFTNNLYKRQLNADLICDDISVNDAKNLAYYEQQLLKFFRKYNKCKGQISDIEQKKQAIIHLAIRPGIVLNSYEVTNKVNDMYSFDFGAKTQLRIGVEAELILPFNKNKWSLFLEPVYSSFKAEGGGTEYTSEVNYKVIDFQMGIRHYMFLSSKSSIFLNTGIVYAVNISDKEYSPIRYTITLPYEPTPQIVLGVGIKKEKLSAEVRYLGTQNLMATQTVWESKFTSLAFVVGYEIF